jgi:chromosome segregation ATPase
MPERANVTSVEAIESFRSHLIVYLTKARPTVEEVSAEVVRTRSWLETDQRAHWEKEMRRRAKALEQAQQELFSSRISNLKDESSLQQLAVQRAKRALEEADGKLRVVKRWAREFDNRIQPLLKQIEKLHTVLSHDMVQGIASLTQTVNTLAAYAEVGRAPLVAGTGGGSEMKAAEGRAASEGPGGATAGGQGQ